MSKDGELPSRNQRFVIHCDPSVLGEFFPSAVKNGEHAGLRSGRPVSLLCHCVHHSSGPKICLGAHPKERNQFRVTYFARPSHVSMECVCSFPQTFSHVFSTNVPDNGLPMSVVQSTLLSNLKVPPFFTSLFRFSRPHKETPDRWRQTKQSKAATGINVFRQDRFYWARNSARPDINHNEGRAHTGPGESTLKLTARNAGGEKCKAERYGQAAKSDKRQELWPTEGLIRNSQQGN